MSYGFDHSNLHPLRTESMLLGTDYLDVAWDRFCSSTRVITHYSPNGQPPPRGSRGSQVPLRPQAIRRHSFHRPCSIYSADPARHRLRPLRHSLNSACCLPMHRWAPALQALSLGYTNQQKSISWNVSSDSHHADWTREQRAKAACLRCATIPYLLLGSPSVLPSDFLLHFPSHK